MAEKEVKIADTVTDSRGITVKLKVPSNMFSPAQESDICMTCGHVGRKHVTKCQEEGCICSKMIYDTVNCHHKWNIDNASQKADCTKCGKHVDLI